MVAHLRHLPKAEAVGRVALTVRFLNSGLARWERDSGVGADCVDGLVPLAPFTLILTDLAVAMLEAPSSVPAQADVRLPRPRGPQPARQCVAADTPGTDTELRCISGIGLPSAAVSFGRPGGGNAAPRVPDGRAAGRAGRGMA